MPIEDYKTIALDTMLFIYYFEAKHHFTPKIEQLLKKIPELLKVFINYSTPLDPAKVTSWIMGQLRFSALGNVPLKELKVEVEKVVNHG